MATPGSGSDILFGIGGTPEGVIAACAIQCMGGAILGRLFARNEDERRTAVEQGYDLDRVLTTDDLVSGDEVFFAATGISNGDLLKGVALLGRRGQHREPRDALEDRNDPQDPGHAPLAEADALLGRQVRLTPSRRSLEGELRTATNPCPPAAGSAQAWVSRGGGARRCST